MATRTTYNELTAAQLAEQAAEGVRGLNHLTRDEGSLQTPAEVYRVLGSLELLAARLPQALAQLDALLQRWADAELVSIDDGEFAGDPAAAVATASVYLVEEATPVAVRLQEVLGRAQQAIAFASFTGELPDDGGPS